MKLKLPSNVSSQQDVAAVVVELHEYAKWFSHVAIKKRMKLKRGIDPPEISSTAKELLQQAEDQAPLSIQNLDELIGTLESYQSTAPTITFTLAAAPPADLKKKLVNWCRDNIEPSILVTFQFNATLLGGMIVHYGSHTFDWSFRTKILGNRGAFTEILRNV